MSNATFWPLACLLALSGAATLIIWSVLRVAAQADEANERYAEEVRRSAGEGQRE